MIQATFRPVNQWPRTMTKARRSSPFSAGYIDTLEKLEREIQHLRGRKIVIEIALQEKDIRLDGWPRANARPMHPGVIISFESVHGPLQYCCDKFTDWESNLRAIALTLERLRMADLYGVTEHGEQYKGWQQLPPSPPEKDKEAAQVIALFTGRFSAESILHDKDEFKRAYREAAQRTHPDSGGNADDFRRMQAAADVLKARHGL